MAFGAELHTPGLVERVATTEVTLLAERSTLVVEIEKAKEEIQDLKIARTIAVDKEKSCSGLFGQSLMPKSLQPRSRSSWKQLR